MQSASQFLIALGGILLLGLLTDVLGRRTHLPRVTLLLIFGVIIGKDLLDIIPSVFSDRFEIIADMALLMVGFLLGGRLTVGTLKKSASQILWISISAAVVTTVMVSAGLVWIGVSVEIAILLGCIASATAPAAVLDVVTESGCKGRFSNLLLSIVSLDDVWALLLFGIGIAVVHSISGLDADMLPILIIAREIGGAILLGILIGLPAAYLTGRIKPGQPILIEALGIVFICGGLAIMLDVSFLIASIVMGAVIANFAKHHEYPFHAIEGIEWPFMVIFFVLAGASIELTAVRDIGFIGIVYILCRATGKYLGVMLGSHCGKAGKETKRWMGIALLPQAGVAIGMALVASEHFPEYRQTLLSVIISTTIFFEIIGPVLTRMALQRARNDE
jgi:Kef-type K+ transport system membrane component KefB